MSRIIYHPTLLNAKRICTRHFSASDSYFPYDPTNYIRVQDLLEYSLPHLGTVIDSIYPSLNKDFGFIISIGKLDNVRKLIVSDEYHLSPLQEHYADNKHDLRLLLMEYLMDYTDVQVQMGDNGAKKFIFVTPTKKEDALVLRALSVMLLRLSQDYTSKHYLEFEDLLQTFYESIKNIGKANRIYKIDLEPSKSTIPLHVVEEKIMDRVEHLSINKLLGSLFHLPIIERNGKKGKMSSCGIPSVGEISKALFHITLLHTLDPEFAIKFPGTQFKRIHNEAYIFCKDICFLDEKEVKNLLEKLSLAGNIEYIGPGDKPLTCFSDKLIHFNSDCKVELCDYKDYKNY